MQLSLPTLWWLLAGTPCGDFSKNRLLPSTAPYIEARRKQAKDKGGKYFVTKFPRKGLNGKQGGLFRTAIQIWRWVKIHHPHATCFFENVVFNDMEDDWKEVNASLGEPLVINSMDYSTTARNRALTGPVMKGLRPTLARVWGTLGPSILTLA